MTVFLQDPILNKNSPYCCWASKVDPNPGKIEKLRRNLHFVNVGFGEIVSTLGLTFRENNVSVFAIKWTINLGGFLSPPKTNIAREKWWLEDEFPFDIAYFKELC